MANSNCKFFFSHNLIDPITDQIMAVIFHCNYFPIDYINVTSRKISKNCLVPTILVVLSWRKKSVYYVIIPVNTMYIPIRSASILSAKYLQIPLASL